MTAKIFLKKGREKSALQRHPWIFSGAVARLEGAPVSGDTVQVCSCEGLTLGMASFSAESQITARMWCFDERPVDDAFFLEKIRSAAGLRQNLPELRNSDAFRIVNAESDGLPGVVADKYADFIVCQFLSAGAERNKRAIVAALAEVFKPSGIYERSDARVREKENLPLATGVLAGAEPPDELVISENGCKYIVDVKKGHKTGFYLDQRDNRERFAGFCTGKKVLNCFSFTGGFGLRAALGGASEVLNVDSSADALAVSERNAALNNIPAGVVGHLCGDVFAELRKFRDAAASFDVIVLDPPKFAEGMGQLPRAARAYKDINLLAFKLLRPGGRLFTFSCSGLMKMDLFSKVVSDAALDAGKNAVAVGSLWQASDHPWALNFPEGIYLKGLHCVVS